MGIYTKNRSKLDGKEIFDLWMQLGTLEKVRSSLISRNIINEKSGKPFTLTTIRAAASRWIAQNPDDAREIYRKHNISVALADDLWDEEIMKRAYTVFGSTIRNFMRWARSTKVADGTQTYYEKYPYELKKLYGLVDEETLES